MYPSLLPFSAPRINPFGPDRFLPSLMAVLLALGAASPAMGQGQLVSDRFAPAPKVVEKPVVFSHDGTRELCFASDEFSGDDELFCYDGNSLRQVTSISRYSGGANLEDLTVYDDGSGPKLYFGAWNGKDRDGLWSYDGTSVNFEASIDGSDDAEPSNFAVYDSGSGAKLYFSARDGSNGRELWSYDGSSATLEADINSTGSSDPGDLAVYDDGSGAKLYFSASNGSSGDELWSFDGTDATLEEDINGSGSSDPTGLTVYDDGTGARLYFGATNGSSGRELWSYDGFTAALEEDINGSGDSSPREFAVFDGGGGAKLYFGADGGSSGRELWSYDGSNAALEADINGSGSSSPGSFVVYDDGSGKRLYFGATDGSNGNELWSYDGSNAILEGEMSGSADLSPSELAVYNDGSGSTLYFSADAAGEYNLFYKHSATGTGPVSVTESPREGPSEKVVYNGNLYFEGNGEGDGEELWVYDGSSISQVADIRPGPQGSYPSELTVYNGALYFSANDGSAGEELWKYDGSTVSMAADINGGSASSEPDHLTVYDDGNGPILYFEATDGDSGFSYGYELWSYAGGSAIRETDILSGTDSSLPSDLTVYNDGSGKKLFFRAQGPSGFGLWSFDGSDAVNEADISPGGLTVYGGKVYFSAEESSTGDELWSYDGTDATLEADINDGSGNSYPRKLTVFDAGGGKKLFFSAQTSASGFELWSYDGSNASLVKDLYSGSADSDPENLTVFAGHLYFSARTANEGVEPRTYDGSEVKTADLYSGAYSGGGDDPVVYNDGTGGKLYVTATDGQSGAELFEFTPQTNFLPVELSAFEAIPMGQQAVELSWTTASESGSAGFRVQHRTRKDSAWSQIGFVESQAEGGSSTEPLRYDFVAEDLPVGTHHFRLAQVDLDGSVRRHDPVTAELHMETALRLSGPAPNPVRGQARVSFAVKNQVETDIILYNALGQQVRTLYRGTPSAGTAHFLQLSAKGLASGVYFLKMKTDGKTAMQRLTVVR